jgi:two-component system sensor histidine kinase DesK
MTLRLLPEESEHGWTPYVWLVYLGPYVAAPFILPLPAPFNSVPLAWAVWSLGLAVFLLLYFRGYWVDGARRLPIVVGLTLLGALLAPLNPGALLFFTYASAFVGGAAKATHAGIWVGGITVAGVLSSLLSPWQPLFVLPGVAVMTPIVGFVNLHYVESRRRDAAIRLAQSEIARLATIAERERIARDLHDLLGHTLSVIVLKSELASKLLAREPERAAAELADVERVSRDALAEVRGAVQGFRAATLADELVRARAVLDTARVRVDIDDGDPERLELPRDIEHAAAMILREAVTNVVRHARATTCRIAAMLDRGQFVLQVEDDGVGGTVAEGAGIESMRARAREVGGTLEHHSGRGVSVTLRVPRSQAT